MGISEDILHRVLGLQLEKLTPSQLLRFRECLENAKEAHPLGLTVGTGCSGSDVVILVLEKLGKFWDEMLGVRLRFRHVFSIESVAWKREWITSHFQPELVFDDITAIDGSESLHGTLSGELRPLPACDMFFCGIECDTISALNARSDLGGCIQGQRGKTGQTAKGCFDYIEKRRPLIWVVENVRSLSTSVGHDQNFASQQLLEMAHKLGYAVHVRHLDSM